VQEPRIRGNPVPSVEYGLPTQVVFLLNTKQLASLCRFVFVHFLSVTVAQVHIRIKLITNHLLDFLDLRKSSLGRPVKE
jgi:hypothetical protein